jgi:3-methyladenine DNA glycosylase AlkC
MFNILNENHLTRIRHLIDTIDTTPISTTVTQLHKLIEQIRGDIPEKKRISYGRYSITKKMGEVMYPPLREKNVDIIRLSTDIFDNPDHDEFVRSLAVQLLSLHGESGGKPETVLPFVEKAAMDDSWIVRECSAGYVRKLIKKYPDQMRKWYLKMVRSKNPLQRRFAGESLRPVADNGWFRKRPEFVFPIISNLYREHEEYPRTSIGNSLSDWMRIDKERTLRIVKKLAKSGNKDSHWIAYRACRNLVKKEPLLVMEMLGIDHYKYKDRNFKREQFEK